MEVFQVLTYIVKVEDDGKYYVTHTRFPGVKVCGNSLYAAIEAFDKILRDKKVSKATKETETLLIQERKIIV